MKNLMITLCLGAGLAALPLAGGCDSDRGHEVSHQSETIQHPNGEVSHQDTTVTEKPNGDVVREQNKVNP